MKELEDFWVYLHPKVAKLAKLRFEKWDSKHSVN
jgi:hypothetical protein